MIRLQNSFLMLSRLNSEMKNLALILLLFFSLIGCKSSKGIDAKKSKSTVSETIENTESTRNPKTDSLANLIIDYAKQFNGVKYKYGGTTKKGMDCSGLVTTAFKSRDISLPRTTEDLALEGHWIDLKDVQKGDLLFFATKKNNRKVNHVGLVTEARFGFVEFIHASTSLGVIISNLAERYWYTTFVQARRIL